MFIDGRATEPYRIVGFKPTVEIPQPERFTRHGYLLNQLAAGDHFINLIIVPIAFSATASEAARYRLGALVYYFDSNIANPELEVVVRVGEPIAYFKVEVIDKHLLRIVAKWVAAWLMDAMVNPMDVEVVKIIIVPPHGYLDDMMQVRQGR